MGKKTYYKDDCGNTYSIEENKDGSAILRYGYINTSYGFVKNKTRNQKYKTLSGAKISLSRYCGGMPSVTSVDGKKKRPRKNIER